MKALLLIAVVVASGACHDAPQGVKPGTPDELAAYLKTVAGADKQTRKREVSTWIVDETTWSRDVVEPYRGLYSEYVAGFDAQVPALVAQLASAGVVTARRHYAGDKRLTLAEARLRWAVPVQFPSVVAELDGKPIDAVFVHDGGRWRALVGLDPLMLAHVAALDPACEKLIEHAGPSGRCTEVGWLVADSALRGDRQRFAHACQLASTLCGNPGP
ncbi:MAG TPA: hypothetical protein VF403_12370 [Kofleriaceae bacterium]